MAQRQTQRINLGWNPIWEYINIPNPFSELCWDAGAKDWVKSGSSKYVENQLRYGKTVSQDSNE